MITGRVSAELEATIIVDLIAGDGRVESVECLIDTGFNGHLALPASTIRNLDLPYRGRRTGTLADGSLTSFNVFRGSVRWHGRERSVVVLEGDGGALLGMDLLKGSHLSLPAVVNGHVAIEELS